MDTHFSNENLVATTDENCNKISVKLGPGIYANKRRQAQWEKVLISKTFSWLKKVGLKSIRSFNTFGLSPKLFEKYLKFFEFA